MFQQKRLSLGLWTEFSLELKHRIRKIAGRGLAKIENNARDGGADGIDFELFRVAISSSTFQIDMKQIARMLSQRTNKSLLLIDEFVSLCCEVSIASVS